MRTSDLAPYDFDRWDLARLEAARLAEAAIARFELETDAEWQRFQAAKKRWFAVQGPAIDRFEQASLDAEAMVEATWQSCMAAEQARQQEFNDGIMEILRTVATADDPEAALRESLEAKIKEQGDV